MRAPHWNALVDAAAYVGFVALAATGLVLEYQLPPGSGGLHGGRGGRGAGEREVELLWGFTRHDWGAVHYWIALALLAVLAVHLILHWKWIVCMIRGKPSQASGMRFGLGAAGLLGVIALGVLPFVTSTDTKTRATLQQEAAPAADDSASPQFKQDSELLAAGSDQKSTAFEELRGRNTLAEAAQAAGVDVAQLRVALKLPADTPADARFSSFIHEQDLSMDQVRQLLAKLKIDAGEP